MIRWTQLFVLLIVASPAHLAAADGGRPNFVFFITDDVGAEDLGFYGNAQVATPAT